MINAYCKLEYSRVGCFVYCTRRISSIKLKNLPKTEINRLQHTQNSLARTVANTPKYSHITPVLKSLHWLKIEQRMQYKLISLTYKILTIQQQFSTLTYLPT